MQYGWFNNVVDVLFPPDTVVLKARTISESSVFNVMRLRHEPSAQSYTVLPYTEEHIRLLIRANKYYDDVYSRILLGKVLHETLIAVLEEKVLDSLWSAFIIVPMPSSPQRMQTRGFNQIERIVKTLPHHDWNGRLLTNILKKHNRPSQTTVLKTERARNIHHAFYISKKYKKFVQDKNVLLIDDVLESGSTMKDAARALYGAGAHEVIGIALAK